MAKLLAVFGGCNKDDSSGSYNAREFYRNNNYGNCHRNWRIAKALGVSMGELLDGQIKAKHCP